MTDPVTLSPEDAALAAEFAMGVLDPAEHAAFGMRLRDEPVLLAEVQIWQERLVPLTDGIDEKPPARVKRALEARLFGAPRKAVLRIWQGLSVVGLGAAAVLAVMMFVTPLSGPGPATGPVHVAEIVAEDNSLRLLAVYEGDELRLTRTTGTARPGRALEVWLIAGDGVPKSLGVLPAEQMARLTVPAALRALIEGGTLAISDEPEGGSPTGLPTGDVLAVGVVTTL
ncbi:MAG: anti-sigma factor [Rhodobacter sp.]|nr:anti-sigma factor [Rhodobacter sp.]